jgi:DNA topoisomerase I
MVRLRNVSPNGPGWTRRRSGRGFVYLDQAGERITGADAERCRDLVIPPAWRDVWICPHHNGHIQAVGVDDAGRRQYLYHPDWRAKQDELKFERVAAAARRLPDTRATISDHLAVDGMPVERAAATAVRLLDLGYFRIGSIDSVENGSFGLTTLQKRHVRRRRGRLVFRFEGKSGIEHEVEVDDSLAIEAVETMRRRRSGERLLAYKSGARWAPLDAAMVNDYLRECTGADLTAKDFRTWHATVIAAAALAGSDEPGESKASRKRAVVAAMKEVAEYLGNTPAIARSAYVDPRILDLYEDGVTIRSAVRRSYDSPDERQHALERAVIRLLRSAPRQTGRAARSGG